LGRIGGPRVKAALERRKVLEPEEAVKKEIEVALAR
jgi:hypothetical protein